MQINYIIATYSAPIPSRMWDEKSEFVLETNLNCLYPIVNKNITQVTIVCPKPRSEPYKNYYNKEKWIEKFKAIPHTKLEYLDYEGENTHASYDQWIQAYLAFPNFDYYILCEDDYTIRNKNFDVELTRIYKEKFPNNIGYLCSRAGKNSHPYHAMISNGMVSRETFEKLGKNILDIFYSKNSSFAQIKFSMLFQDDNISILDYSEYYIVKFHPGGNKILDYSTKEGLQEELFVPIQTILYCPEA